MSRLGTYWTPPQGGSTLREIWAELKADSSSYRKGYAWKRVRALASTYGWDAKTNLQVGAIQDSYDVERISAAECH